MINDVINVINVINIINIRLEKQMVQAQGLTEEWLKRAKLALEKGDEEAARAALERKNQQEEIANGLRAQVASSSSECRCR